MPFFTTTATGELVVTYGPSVALTPTDFIESINLDYEGGNPDAGPTTVEINIRLINQMVSFKTQLTDAATYASAEKQTEMAEKIYEEFRLLPGQSPHTGNTVRQYPQDFKFTTVSKNGMLRVESDPTMVLHGIRYVTYSNLYSMSDAQYKSCSILSPHEKRLKFNIKKGMSRCDLYITVDQSVTHTPKFSPSSMRLWMRTTP